MRHRLVPTLCFSGFAAAALANSSSLAQTVHPIDRADILAGSRFDLKVEFEAVVDPAQISVTLNGEDLAKAFGRSAQFTPREDNKDQSSLILRDVSLETAGSYRVEVRDGMKTRQINWNVYDTGPRQAKNVILFVGDGMSVAHRVAARLLSKGIAEGKTRGKLAMDDMPHMALVATAGSDSIITDSANSASAYATGHKTAVNAMGGYADRTTDPFDDPRVETISSLVKRRNGMAVGIVTNTEIQDATPAAMFAHTRRRGEYDRIVEQMLAAKPDVILGGGRANFLPDTVEDGKRRDGVNYLTRFREAGYPVALTGPGMLEFAGKPDTTRLLGLFTPGNMDGVLDRKFLKGGNVKKYPEQPDLTEQLRAALDILSRHEAGFFLMVESGLIDKYTHRLDMERAVYDTIMLDNAVRLARDWSSARGDDTLILVVADHTHSVSLIGTINDDMTQIPNTPMRERVGVYDHAGFPNYPAPGSDGYPPRVDVSRRLAIFAAGMPDHYETFRPKLDDPNNPTTPGKEKDSYVADDRNRRSPGAVFREGNLPTRVDSGVHSGEDVILTATGPGSDRVRGQLDNTEIFRIMTEALGLGAKQAATR